MKAIRIAKRSLIASSGGIKAHQLGKAHVWTSAEARAAGKIGGAHRSKKHQSLLQSKRT